MWSSSLNPPFSSARYNKLMRVSILLWISAILTLSSSQQCPTNYFTYGCASCFGYPYIYQNRCVSSCPLGTTPNSTRYCVQRDPCASFPNSSYNGSVCLCNSGYILQGNACIPNSLNPCARIPNSYFNGTTCVCSNGYVMQNAACVQTSPISNPCDFIPNSYFNGTMCVCRTGYVQQGTSCVSSTVTNPCSFIPNTVYNGYSCVCASGYTLIGAQCVQTGSGGSYTVPPITGQYVPSPTNPTIPNPSGPPITCPQGSYPSGRDCQPCTRGCSICTSAYQCTACMNGFRVLAGNCT